MFVCVHKIYVILLFWSTFQFVYPAYTTLLGHLRSKALEDFKAKLEQSLNNEEGFASSVRMWTESIMLEFDKGSTGNSQIGFFFITYTLSPVNLYACFRIY